MTAPLNNDQLTLIDDAKQGMTTLALFQYQALIEKGFSEGDAKKRVADFIEEAYNHYANIGQLESKALGGPVKRLEKVVETLATLSKEDRKLMGVYNELVQIHAQITKKR